MRLRYKLLIAFSAYIIMTSIVTTSLFSYGFMKSGSWAGSIEYWRGIRLIVKPVAVALGTVEAGSRHDVVFELRNVGRQEIKIVGHQKSCSCVIIDKLPEIFEPSSVTRLNLSVHAPEDGTQFSESLVLYTNDRSRPSIRLVVSGSAESRVSTAAR